MMMFKKIIVAILVLLSAFSYAQTNIIIQESEKQIDITNEAQLISNTPKSNNVYLSSGSKVSACITGTPPTLACGSTINVPLNAASGLYGSPSTSAPSCLVSGDKYTYSNIYSVTYQPGQVISIDGVSAIWYTEVLSADGCTNYGCNTPLTSFILNESATTIQSSDYVTTLGLDGMGLVAGTTYLIKVTNVANCGGSPCSSASAVGQYNISCTTNLANACQNNVTLSGATSYSINNLYTSDVSPSTVVTIEDGGCGYSIESNLIYSWCTGATTVGVSVQLSSFSILNGTSTQFAILSGACGGPYGTAMCSSGITSNTTIPVTGITANTCYWIMLDGNAGTHFSGTLQIINSALLPVELISFESYKNGKNVNLDWATATESKSKSFIIEKSQDGSTFESFNEIKAAGYSLSTLRYNITDYNPFDGITYYRLKQVDLDGKYYYSKSVAVENDTDLKLKIEIAPNPNIEGSKSNIIFNQVPSKEIKIVICDVNGVVVFEETKKIIDTNKYELPAEFSKGVYIVKVLNSDVVLTKRMLIK